MSSSLCQTDNHNSLIISFTVVVFVLDRQSQQSSYQLYCRHLCARPTITTVFLFALLSSSLCQTDNHNNLLISFAVVIFVLDRQSQQSSYQLYCRHLCARPTITTVFLLALLSSSLCQTDNHNSLLISFTVVIFVLDRQSQQSSYQLCCRHLCARPPITTVFLLALLSSSLCQIDNHNSLLISFTVIIFVLDRQSQQSSYQLYCRHLCARSTITTVFLLALLSSYLCQTDNHNSLLISFTIVIFVLDRQSQLSSYQLYCRHLCARPTITIVFLLALLSSYLCQTDNHNILLISFTVVIFVVDRQSQQSSYQLYCRHLCARPTITTIFLLALLSSSLCQTDNHNSLLISFAVVIFVLDRQIQQSSYQLYCRHLCARPTLTTVFLLALLSSSLCQTDNHNSLLISFTVVIFKS